MKYKYYKNSIYNEYYKVFPDGIQFQVYSIYPKKVWKHRKWRYAHSCTWRTVPWKYYEITELDMFQVCLDNSYMPYPDA